MDGIARGGATVVDAIDLGGLSVLDIGAVREPISQEFARRKADLQATVFDFPDVLVITRRLAGLAGLRIASRPLRATRWRTTSAAAMT